MNKIASRRLARQYLHLGLPTKTGFVHRILHSLFSPPPRGIAIRGPLLRDGDTAASAFRLPGLQSSLPWRACPTGSWVLRKGGQKKRKHDRENHSPAAATEARSAVPSGQQGVISGVRYGAQRTTVQINRYLYFTRIWSAMSNARSSIGIGRPPVSSSRTPRLPGYYAAKAEGLGYALRLLGAFEPEFRELTDAAIRLGSQ